MKKLVRLGALTLVLICLLVQVVSAAPAYVSGGNMLRPNGPVLGPNIDNIIDEIIADVGASVNEPGHFPWISEAPNVEEAKESIDGEEVYVSPSTGMGAAAIVTCVSAAGLAVLKLTKKKEQ